MKKAKKAPCPGWRREQLLGLIKAGLGGKAQDQLYMCPQCGKDVAALSTGASRAHVRGTPAQALQAQYAYGLALARKRG